MGAVSVTRSGIDVCSVPMAAAEARRKRGPAAGATREEVLARATAEFLACRRIDVQAIAADCGVGRATIYRWYGSRDQLIGEAMLGVVSARIADARRLIGGHGAGALLDTLDLVYRGLSAAPHVRAFIERDRTTALPLMTSSSGPLHPRMIEIVRGLIDEEIAHGGYAPPTDSATLAYVLVRLAEGLLFNYAQDDIPKDLDHLREVVAALLGAT
ncbi:MAG: TetR family transcriptional regulator [Solirubrobacteraceae bacterium]|nr:TetR family transcriptional regulator [Solirubrobacteraceae bacterium]